MAVYDAYGLVSWAMARAHVVAAASKLDAFLLLYQRTEREPDYVEGFRDGYGLLCTTAARAFGVVR
jgi:hypothetical protein